jgi:hypothetical protein
MNKLVIFDPITKSNIPEFFNSELESAYKSDKIKTVTFVFSDLFDNFNDANKTISNYVKFMNEWNLPYVFYPYYSYFNKIMPAELHFPNPQFEIKVNDKVVNVVNQPAYGLLIVNVQKLKSIDYKFPVEFSQLYYIQDLIEHCYQNKLWISNNKFIDMFESWKTVKSLRKATFSANMEKFNAEAEEYGKKQINYQSAQEFIDKFKEVYAK